LKIKEKHLEDEMKELEIDGKHPETDAEHLYDQMEDLELEMKHNQRIIHLMAKPIYLFF
jgi:hypothetical protein